MTRGTRLGEFEFIVLAAVMRLGESGYGANVRQEIETRLDRNVSLGAVYATLDRLEQKGYVRSWFGEPTPQRGGKAKRFFAVHPAGRDALQHTYADFRTMTAELRLGRAR